MSEMKSEEQFGIEKVLSDVDKGKLYELMRMPGWKVLIGLVDNLQYDWAEQIMSHDYSGDNDTKIIQDLLKKQGMRNGLVQFFRHLQLWKRAQDRQIDNDTK